jgi:uncharacterized protein
MIFDCHNHIGFDPINQRNRSIEELISEMNDNSVTHAIVFPFTSNPDIIGQNKIIHKAIKKYPSKITGFFTMNPKLSERINLMEEYKEQGFRGVTLDLRFGPGFGDRRVHELMECAFINELIVWIHTDQKDISLNISAFENLVQKFGGVKFILSSMFRNTFYVASKFKNIYIDTPVFELSQDLTRHMQSIGTHRFLIGTNTPLGMFGHEVNKIQISPELTPFQKKLILGRNLNKLLI